MSNAAKQQLGLKSEKFRNAHFPSHDLHIGQEVMYQNATSKWWYPATITSLSEQPRCYNLTTREGVTYRETQVLLKYLYMYTCIYSFNKQLAMDNAKEYDLNSAFLVS